MRYLFKILLLIIGLSFPVLGQVDVSLPDTTGDYQTVINIPVYTSDLTGQNVTQYNFKVSFDGQILEAQDVKVSGTLSDEITWTVTPTIKKNSIEVNADGIFALSGSGVLVYLTFNVTAQSGSTALTFEDFTFNNGTPFANTHDGSFTVNEKAILNLNSAGDGEGKVYVNGALVNLPYSAEYNVGEAVELFAEAELSSNFTGWTGDIQTTENPVVVTMDSDKSITVNFNLKEFTITTSSNPAEGGTTTGDGVYKYGTQATVTATPAEGWDFLYWTEDGTEVSNSPTYVFTVAADRNLVANFQKHIFNITTSPNPAEGGTTTGDGRYEYGAQAIVTAFPNDSYDFNNWTENSVIVSTDSQYVFTVSADRNLTANFEKRKFLVKTSANPEDGGTTSGDGQYFYGDNVTVSATPSAGYRFLNWTENNLIVSTSKNYSFTIVSERNLVANFKRIKYTIETSSNPQNGGSTDGDGQYFYGESVTVTATPNIRFVFENWTENNTIVSTSAQYTFTVERNRNLVANFEIKAFTISANPVPSYGGSVTGTGNYKYGETAVLKAKANYGYKFLEWRENGNHVSSDTVLSFTVDKNRTFNAVFTEREYSVTCAAFPPEGGITSGCGVFKYNKTANLKSSPYPGWKFINWTDDQGKILSDKAEFDIVVTKNITVFANFEEELFTINCMSVPSDAGFTSGCGVFKYGQTAELKAIPNINWKFDYWSNSTGDTLSVDSLYIFTVEQTEDIIANFTTLTGIKNLEFNGTIPNRYFVDNNYPNPFNPSTVIKFGLPFTSVVSLEIFNINGQVVKELVRRQTLSPGIYNYTFDAGNLASGIYFYRIVAQSLENENIIREIRKMVLLK